MKRPPPKRETPGAGTQGAISKTNYYTSNNVDGGAVVNAVIDDAAEFLEWLWGPYGGGSACRPWHVLKWSCLLDESMGETFWRVVGETWSSFALIPHPEFSKLFVYFRDSAPRHEIPERMTVYRGQDAGAPLGISWTTSKAIAEGFARGHRGKYNPSPVLYSTEVIAPEIAFLCNDREESETVLFEIPDVGELDVIPMEGGPS